jgi:hypothetical protein
MRIRPYTSLLAALLLLPVAIWADLPIENLEPATGGPPGSGIKVPAPADGGARPERDPSVRQPLGDMMVFKDGDTLRGNLVASDAKDGFVWKRPDILAPVVFNDLSNLRGVKLQKMAGNRGPEGQTRVRLTNDDLLYGKVLDLNEESLTMETWYAGKISVRRAMIRSLQPSGKLGTDIYTGPNNLTEWNRQGDWRMVRDRISGSGTLGREMKLPDMASIKFDFIWQGRYLNYSLSFYTDDTKNYYGDCYMLMLQNNNIYLNRNQKNQGQNNLGQVTINELPANQKVRFELLVNKKDRSFTLLINDKMIRQWTDNQEWAGRGTGVVIYTHDRAATVSFGDIRISTWDGKVRTEAEVKAGKEDSIQFINDDRISGGLVGITNGHVAFKTQYATLDIPLERVGIMTFNDELAERPRRNKSDIQVFYPDGEHLTLKLEKLADRRLQGASESLGEVSCTLDAFSGIKFNIYDNLGVDAAEEEPLVFEDLLFD